MDHEDSGRKTPSKKDLQRETIGRMPGWQLVEQHDSLMALLRALQQHLLVMELSAKVWHAYSACKGAAREEMGRGHLLGALLPEELGWNLQLGALAGFQANQNRGKGSRRMRSFHSRHPMKRTQPHKRTGGTCG